MCKGRACPTHRPILEFAVANRLMTLGGAAVLAGLAVLGVQTLGLEFLPHLEEGNLWIRATLPPSISLEEAEPYVNRMRRVIKGFPEVVTVISQLGRPDDGTDTTGFFNAEFNVPLKPFDASPRGIDKEKLTQQVSDRLTAEFPGVDFNFSQYIEDNVEEAASGIKGENSVKLFGNDLAAIQKTAYEIKAVLKTVSGITDLSVFELVGQPTVNIDVDRERAARYGLAPGDINSTIAAAIGGTAAGNVYEYGSDRNFPIVVRLAPKYRESLDAIRRITVGAPNPSGNGVVPIPLSDVAKVELVSGPLLHLSRRPAALHTDQIQRAGPRSRRRRARGPAEDRAAGTIAERLSSRMGRRVRDLEDALGRLKIVVPLSIALILLLLFINFSSLVDMLLAASVMPMALIGGIFALVLTGTAFSVSAAIGFVGLFGVSVMEGIIILSYFNSLIDAGVERSAAVVRACQIRLRPVMMTCIAACVGLMPAAVSTGIGAQVQKPLALVIVGGILLAPVLILIVLPVLIDIFSQRRPPATPPAPAGSE